MVIMASGIARGRVRTTATQHGGHIPKKRLTETQRLDLLCTSLILDNHVTIN